MGHSVLLFCGGQQARFFDLYAGVRACGIYMYIY